MDETTDQSEGTGSQGPVPSRSKVCTKCKTNTAPSNSSWCRECRNEQAAEYRARMRKPIVTEMRACAWEECENEFEWSSKAARQICCSRSCYGKYRWRRDNPEFVVGEGLILCTKCGQEKPKSEYAPSRQHLKRSHCRDCAREYERRWDRENRDKRSAATRRSRRARLLRQYGAPTDDYDELLRLQGGVCLICGRPDDGARSFHVDHDHSKPEEKSYRALLCGTCNAGIGGFNDDPDLLRAAADYIEKYR